MEETVELVKKLVSIPSTLGDTGGVEEFVASRLARVTGADVSAVPVGSLGNDVVASVMKGGEHPIILLNGHLDTVDVCKGWTRDPFKPEREGDKLYGLGSADMKAGVAIAMQVFRSLASMEGVNVIFAGTVDEEGDSAGAFALIERGVSADLCLIPEPSGGSLMMGCRGRMVFEADVRGASAHGARPADGVNAIVEAGRLAVALDSVQPAEHDKLGKGSLCILEIAGGTRTLSVPDSCRMKIDRHYVLGETGEGMLSQLSRAADGLGSRASFGISTWKSRPTPFLEPYITENAGLVKFFTDAVGGEFSYGKSVGDYNAFAKVAPTVVYGPHGESWHGPDKFVSIASIESCIAGYGAFLAALGRR